MPIPRTTNAIDIWKECIVNAFLQNAIFGLFDSTEIINHLRSNQERLQPTVYAEIIAGAPISLDKKLRLLKCLESTTKDETNKSVISEYVRCAEHAVEALHAADGSRFIFHVSLMYFDPEDGCADHCDGPFPAVSLNKAKQAIAIYRAKNDTDFDDWSEIYWAIELYDLAAEPAYDGFLQPRYVFFATTDGEIEFFSTPKTAQSHRVSSQRKANAFGPGSEHLDIPLPFVPGDILRIDNRPFVPGPAYCLITQTGTDCCGVQCMYPCRDGHIRFGALKHGDFFDRSFVFQPSPLFSARRYVGELPDDCKFMKKLSDTIRSSPELGKTLNNLWPHLGFSIEA